MIGTPRRTCRGRPIICPGPCNHRRQKCIERKPAEKPHWHACSWLEVNEEDDEQDDDDDEEEKDGKKTDVGKIGLPVKVDEIATMTINATLIDVALSQMTMCLEKKEEKIEPRPVSTRCNYPGCSEGVSQMKTEGSCSEKDQAKISKCPPGVCTKSPVIPTTDTLPKRKQYKKLWSDRKLSIYSIYLLVFCLYALVHMVIAALATPLSLYDAFLSSQICGLAAFVVWRATGTIPL